MTKQEKIRKTLENAAKRGNFEKTLWMSIYQFKKLSLKQGLAGEILKSSKHNAELVKVNICWKDACKCVTEETLSHYIKGDISFFPTFGIKLYVFACRAEVTS